MVAVEKITSSSLKNILESDRDTYNSLFMIAQHSYPRSRIQAGIFFDFLKQIVEPVVKHLEILSAYDEDSPGEGKENRDTNRNPADWEDRLRPLVRHLYERILELMGIGLLGDRARHPHFEKAFTRVVTGLPQLLLQQPKLFTGAIANAIMNVTAIVDHKVKRWVDTVCHIGLQVKTVNEFLECGKVAAWRWGLAHYRKHALETCHKLRPELVRQILEIPADDTVEQVLEKLAATPWYIPGAISSNETENLLIQRSFGGFAGFGGPFISPPEVIEQPGCEWFLVRDARRRFAFFCDIFGKVLLPISAGETCEEEQDKKHNPPVFKISQEGTIEHEGYLYEYPRLSGHSSFAANDYSYCVTHPLSHYLFFGGPCAGQKPEDAA